MRKNATSCVRPCPWARSRDGCDLPVQGTRVSANPDVRPFSPAGQEPSLQGLHGYAGSKHVLFYHGLHGICGALLQGSGLVDCYAAVVVKARTVGHADKGPAPACAIQRVAENVHFEGGHPVREQGCALFPVLFPLKEHVGLWQGNEHEILPKERGPRFKVELFHPLLDGGLVSALVLASPHKARAKCVQGLPGKGRSLAFEGKNVLTYLMMYLHAPHGPISRQEPCLRAKRSPVVQDRLSLSRRRV